MREKISCEEAENRIFIKHGSTIKMLEYNGAGEKSKFQCKKCEYIWRAVTSSVWRVSGCPKCGIKSRTKKLSNTFEYVKNFIESNNCELLSSNYKNVDEKLIIKLDCGHVVNLSFYCFKIGVRCAICASENLSKNFRRPLEDFEKLAKSNGITILDYPNGYKNNKSKALCICNSGHILLRTVGSIIYNGGCQKCSFEKMSVDRMGSLGSNWQGGKSGIRKLLQKKICNWKKDSLEDSGYRCVICSCSGSLDVHHKYGFNNIFNEMLSELLIDNRKYVQEYSEEELNRMADKLLEIHYRYPLGVALCRNHHKLFHKLYGHGNNTPQQFEEFKQRIQSGDIQLPD